ncbi:MAG: hypothetical protein ACFCVD_25270 [Nodosilinea sp.]
MKSPISTRIIVLALFALLFWLRRPADALDPAVWAEDGLHNIPQAVEYGWGSLGMPVNGYLIVPSKILTLTALGISGLFYPEVAYGLTFLATLAVLWGLTSGLIAIRGMVFLPLIIALLPYNPEVFATPLYIFWWTSLLLLLPLLAHNYPNPCSLGTQVMVLSLVVIGGLSSPLGIVLWPLMLWRACITQRRLDYVGLGVWTGVSLLQLALAMLSSGDGATFSVRGAIITGALPTFLGNYLLHDGWLAQDNWITYGLFVALVGLALYWTIQVVKGRDLELFYVVCPLVAMFGSILVALARLGFAPEPMEAGPRYFFFPFIFLSLFLMAAASYTRRSVVKYGCIGLILMACTLTWVDDGSKFYRLHDPLSWRQELQACRQASGPYGVKIHSDGSLAQVWLVELTPEACRRISDGGILAQYFGLTSDRANPF